MFPLKNNENVPDIKKLFAIRRFPLKKVSLYKYIIIYEVLYKHKIPWQLFALKKLMRKSKSNLLFYEHNRLISDRVIASYTTFLHFLCRFITEKFVERKDNAGKKLFVIDMSRNTEKRYWLELAVKNDSTNFSESCRFSPIYRH